MKRLYSLIIFWGVFICSSGQTVIFQPEMNILYRGVENLIEIGVNNQYEDLNISCFNCNIYKRNDSTFIVPGNNYKSTITIEEKETSKIIFEQHYRLQNLPYPVLYFGGQTDGVIPNNSNLLELKPQDYIFFPIKYQIKSWTIYCDGDSISGNTAHVDKKKLSLIFDRKKPLAIDVNYITNYHTEGKVSAFFQPNLNIKSAKQFEGKFIVLDKQDFFEELFDTNNILSLMSMIRQNQIVDPEFLAPSELKRIENSGFSETINYYYGNAIYLPLKGINGLDSLDNNGHVVNSPNQSWGIDLTDISKIILYIEEIESTPKITKIGLAKKYPNSEKYDVTCVLNAENIFEMFPKYHYSPHIQDSLLNNSQLIKSMRNYQFERYSKLDYNTAIQTPSPIRFLDNSFPFNRHSYSGIIIDLRHENSEFPFQRTWNEKNTDLFTDKSFMHLDISDIPLLDRYGEDTVDINGNYVYPVYGQYIYWKDVTNLIPFIEWELNTNRVNEKKQLVVNRLVYCIKDNTNFTPIFYFDFKKDKNNINENSELISWIVNVESKYNAELYKLQWEKTIKKVMQKQKRFNPSKRKDLRILRETFNLPESNGKPLSLLGIF